ncbi:hypothetical protein ASG39_11240 [Rhizobium sp. Leaf371]|uniref:hypothetical protein n=1 Tax=Rhizobium sp. Leaf371 TaxID=1736355 RepID=UPI000715A678|nr:hypothetical protein [Rhizobium sp. Leaf371]KQS64522.1 hypothetical protein ASG39_11240 [Rhizobium sp. Leaf371]
MKLAEEIWITVADEEIELRPSLRYAIQLERRDGSFGQLLREVQEGSLTAALSIIEPHADAMPYLENRVFDALPTLKAPLIAYLLACAGIDPDDAPKASKGKSGKSVPFKDHLIELYKLGTGWLGWTPDVTLDATPAEITLAYAGHMDMLRAIHGGGKAEKPKDDRPLDQKFRSIFAGIGTQKPEAA